MVRRVLENIGGGGVWKNIGKCQKVRWYLQAGRGWVLEKDGRCWEVQVYLEAVSRGWYTRGPDVQKSARRHFAKYLPPPPLLTR